MKVVLVFPGIASVGFGSFGNPALEYTASMIHHGLCFLSACAKQAGHQVTLIDLRRLRGWGDYRDELARLAPDVVGITSMSLEYGIARQCAKIAKEANPSVVTVIGGIHATVATDEVLAEQLFDHVVVGEGEISFVELLRDLEAGRSAARLITGIPPSNLDKLPFADRELFDYTGELNTPFLDEVFGFKPPSVTILTSRGCAYNCSFCQPSERTLFGKQVRRRSVANVMEELRQLSDRYAFRSLVIHDDSVTQDVAWATEFCTSYKDHGFTQPFFAQSRADFICDHEQTFALLAGAGLKAVSIGFESGSDRVLRHVLRKGVTVEQNLRAATICRRYGVKIFANYMLGIPGETKDEVRETVRMMRSIHPDHHGLSFYTPLPGSDLFSVCREQGLLLNSADVVLDRGILSPKLRGVDYEFLQHAAEEAQDLPWLKRSLRRVSRTPFGMGLKRVVARLPFGAPLLIGVRRFLRSRT